jgi:hypothetical protein
MMQIGDILTAKNIAPLEGNTIAPPLTLEEQYTAKKVYVCPCGQDHIDVGLKSEYNYIRCYSCKKEIPEGDSIHWCHPTRFAQV